MITFEQHGNLKSTNTFLERCLEIAHIGDLDKYGRKGVEALKASTPVDTGTTAKSWSYKIERKKGYTSIVWLNSHIEDGCNIAVILQYGHATENGYWVEGIDYINPAIKPLFREIADKIWKEVTRK